MPCSSTILPRTRREQRPRKDRYQYHFKHQDCVQSLTLAHSLVGREPWLGRAGRSQASFSRRRRCFGIQLFEDRCNFSIEHDNKYLFSRSERSERRVNNCLSRLRGTALSVMAVWARLTWIRSLVTVQENGSRPPALISVASWFSGMYTFIKKAGFYFFCWRSLRDWVCLLFMVIC